MKPKLPSRRQFVTSSAAVAAGLALTARVRADAKPFRIMLNTSTIRECKVDGQKLPIDKKVEVASKAGYDCIEPWINELADYKKSGKALKDLAKLIKDSGLVVESAIGFAEWIVNDDARRAKGLDQAKRDMEMVLEIGGKRLAAPPVGATQPKDDTVPVEKIADRYKVLAELGEKIGILPMAEVWGFSKTFTTLNETIKAAMLSGHPKAMILPDIYHLYKGGSSFEDMKQLTNGNFQVLHVNDYPNIPKEKIQDKDRVYPGDGIAPITQLIKDLKAMGYTGLLSLELFNPEYWKQDPNTVAKTGIEKVKAALAKAA
ncbi:MAG TPA: TIM barrel protein [Planctomycetota bacterium]|nr:TIM barrel protein [Planctomycetota bacterium]